jgi:hypothetical protein
MAGNLTGTAQNRGTSSNALHDGDSERSRMRKIVGSKIEILLAKGTSQRSLYVSTKTVVGVNTGMSKTLRDFSFQETLMVLFILVRSVAG